jgi:hypothetical protein
MIKKKKEDTRLVNLENQVKNNLNKLCDFDLDIVFNNVKTNSCYDFQKSLLVKNDDFIPTIDNSNEDIPKYKSKIINMSVTNVQATILQKWLTSYIDMYNIVIRFFIKSYIYDKIRNLKIIYDENKILYFDMIESNKELKSLQKQRKKLNTDYNKLIKNGKKKNKLLVNIKNKLKNESRF